MTTPTFLSYVAQEAILSRERNRIAPTAIGAACTSFDISGLDCESKGGFIINVVGKSVGTSAGYVSLRINGALTNISRVGHFSGIFPAAPSAFGDAFQYLARYNNSGGVANALWTFSAMCVDPRIGKPRRIQCDSHFLYAGPSSYYQQSTTFVYLNTSSEIVSVGFETDIASDIHADTTYEVIRL